MAEETKVEEVVVTEEKIEKTTERKAKFNKNDKKGARGNRAPRKEKDNRFEERVVSINKSSYD